jgi:hypothetical protein
MNDKKSVLCYGNSPAGWCPKRASRGKHPQGGRFDEERRALQWQFCYLRIRSPEVLAETYDIQLDRCIEASASPAHILRPYTIVILPFLIDRHGDS